MTSDANIVVGIEGRIEGGRRVKRTLDEVSRSADKAEKSTERLDRSVKKNSGSFGALRGAITGAGIALAARAFITAADNFTLLEARVKNSTKSVEEFEQAMSRLTGIAAETGSSLNTTVEVFQRISFVREEIGASVDEMANFVEGVQKLGVVSGASTQALNAGLTQLGQGLSAGVLRAEEFNSIIENVPAIANTIAEEFGVTTGQLRQLVLEGEVLSEDVFAAILNQSEEINSQFEQFPMTVGRAFNELILKLQTAAGEINNASGATDVLIFALQKVGQVVDVLVGLFKGFAGIVSASFEFVIAGIIDGFNSAGRTMESVINVAINAINKLTGKNIELVDFASDISRGALAEAALEAATQDIENARKGFKDAFTATVGIFSPQQEKSSTKIAQNTRELSKNYSEIADKLGPANEGSEKLSKELEKIRKETDRFANSAADAFTDFVTGATDARSALQSLLGDLITLLNRQFITEPLGNIFKTVFNPGSGGSGGGFGDILGSLGGSIASGIGGFFGFNSGGSFTVAGTKGVDQNVLSLNGSPVAKVGSGETVSISPGNKGGGAGIVVTQNINLSMGVDTAVAAEVQRALPQIKEVTQAAIKEAELRGIS